MGHTRLGDDLPRTRAWEEVVELLGYGASTEQIATATLNAAERGLNLAAEDQTFVESVWLLTQLPLAGREKNFNDYLRALRSAGLQVSEAPGVMDIVGALSEAVDARISQVRGRTDLGEIAQMSASETISKVLGTSSGNLFGLQAQDVKSTLAELATKFRFGSLARQFFARIVSRCLNYFLSRVLAKHVGEGRRFATLAHQAEFSKAIELHCSQASLIVEDFAGGWASKTKWEKGGISREDARGFAHIAMRKLVAELKAGARSHVQ